MAAIKLITCTHGHLDEEEFDSIQEAALWACSGVDTNAFAPVKILEGEAVVWDNNGPFGDSYDNLFAIAGMER